MDIKTLHESILKDKDILSEYVSKYTKQLRNILISRGLVTSFLNTGDESYETYIQLFDDVDVCIAEFNLNNSIDEFELSDKIDEIVEWIDCSRKRECVSLSMTIFQMDSILSNDFNLITISKKLK